VYVDDTLFFAKDDAVIDRHISELRKLDFELTEEGEVTQFLGIEIHKDANGVITMTQKGLIDAILTLLQLKDESKQHETPAVSPPLHSDEQGMLFINAQDFKLTQRSHTKMQSKE
jgi:hypothetical protein